jgi:hypothetical protein
MAVAQKNEKRPRREGIRGRFSRPEKLLRIYDRGGRIWRIVYTGR